MKKLHALKVGSLPFSSHYDFFMHLREALAAAGAAVKAALASFMPDFNAWLAKEEAVMSWVNKSILTEDIVATVAELKRLLVGINAAVRLGLHASTPEVREAATRLRRTITNYGDIAHKPYDSKAGSLIALLDHFDGDCAADVAALGLEPWVRELHTALSRFDELLRRREHEHARKPDCIARTARRSLDRIYHRMTAVINAAALVGTSPDFEALITLLNPLIDRLNAEFYHAPKSLSVMRRVMVDSLPSFPATGRPVTPVPRVYYRLDDGAFVELALGKDFALSYVNNVNPGKAVITIHGRGEYRGQYTVTFMVVES